MTELGSSSVDPDGHERLLPEQRARVRIDTMLEVAGWVVQDYKAVNLYAGVGVAVRELVTTAGPADYVLFVNRQAVGVIEAKKKGTTLSGVEWQTVKYQTHVPDELLRPGNLNKSGRVTWAPKATTHLPDSFAADSPKYLLRGRHLLMNLTAQSLADDFLGRVCMSGDDDHFLLNQRIARLSSPLAHSEYLFWVFRSSSFREFVAGLNTGSLIQHISTKQLASFVFPLPPLDDQLSLLEEIEAAVAAIDRTEMALELVPHRSSQLRRSILAAAFAGQLVPQDLADEPASALLARMRAEREAASPTKRTRKAKAS